MADMILRGDVYEIDLNSTIGAERNKIRPCVVIQNNVGNKYAPLTIIATIIARESIKGRLPVLVDVNRGEGGLTKDSYIDCGQIRTIDKQRIIGKLGCFTPEIMKKIDRALKISLNLK